MKTLNVTKMKIWWKFLAVFTMVCLLAGASSFPVLAEENLGGEMPINANADILASGYCGTNLIWTLDNDGVLTVAGIGEMSECLDEAVCQWISYHDQVETVVVQPGITSIGSYAFASFSNLKKVTLPEGIASIGECAFIWCENLEEIIMPDSVITIGARAFERCTNMSKIKLSRNIASIGGSAFQQCDGLTEIEIPESVSQIGIAAFYRCTNLTDVYYDGSEEQWNTIIFGDLNENLTTATIHYTDNNNLVRLEAPTDLEWGRYFYPDAESQTNEDIEIEMPGAISWKVNNKKDSIIQIDVYKVGETEPYRSYKWRMDSTPRTDYAFDDFPLSDPESGTYYFTVTLLGDNINYCDSETVVSDTWTYIKPSTQLGDCKNLTWDWPAASWECSNDNEVGAYEIYFYVDKDNKAVSRWIVLDYGNDAPNTVIEDRIIKLNYQGYCYFKVRAISADITVACNGEWSEFSEYYPMPEPTPTIEFEDVVPGSYYEQPVQWAVEKGITNGYGSDTIFNPEGTCTRGQIVTFLWRANGSPEPASLENPFTDVPSNEYYYKAVLWAVENGITAGYGSDTIFNPDGACTRAQVATFMWRAAGKPDMSGAVNPFTDLEEGSFYYDAVLWAVENGITNGYGSADTFCPEITCTRGQIVTFLYRGMN